ncbi:hypothetical protein [Streptomyces sp. NPDC056464]|uniref:hypothetical protein n=1 Tax=Streptomyces sp. NPDC056464 TaxID=3345828 RepID=UPI0036CF6158
MNSHLNLEGASDQINSQLAELPPKRGIIYVDGPSGAGKTALLADFAASTPGAVLVDATGCSAEEVADRAMRAIGVSYGDIRSVHARAGKGRFTDEPLGVAVGGIVGAVSRRSKATSIKLVVEVDSEVYDLSPRNQTPRSAFQGHHGWLGRTVDLLAPPGEVVLRVLVVGCARTMAKN